MDVGMNETSLASVRTWLAEPMDKDVSEADIRAVLRAQRELVKVTRGLRHILNYQGA